MRKNPRITVKKGTDLGGVVCEVETEVEVHKCWSDGIMVSIKGKDYNCLIPYSAVKTVLER